MTRANPGLSTHVLGRRRGGRWRGGIGLRAQWALPHDVVPGAGRHGGLVPRGSLTESRRRLWPRRPPLDRQTRRRAYFQGFTNATTCSRPACAALRPVRLAGPGRGLSPERPRLLPDRSRSSRAISGVLYGHDRRRDLSTSSTINLRRARPRSHRPRRSSRPRSRRRSRRRRNHGCDRARRRGDGRDLDKIALNVMTVAHDVLRSPSSPGVWSRAPA